MRIIVSISAMISEAICYVLLYSSLMEKRRLFKKPMWDTALIFLVMVSGILLLGFIEATYLRGAFGILFSFLVLVFFYQSNILIKIGFAAIPYFIALAVDALTIVMVTGLTSLTVESLMSNDAVLPFVIMIAKGIFSLFVIVFHVFFAKPKNIEYVAQKEWFILFGFSLFCAMAIIALIEVCSMLKEIPFIVIPTAIGLMFSSFIIFWLLKMTAQKGSVITENALIKQQLRAEEENNAALLENYQTQDSLMHDLKDRMNSIQSMLMDGEYEKAAAYVQSLQKEAYANIYTFRTNHGAIDAVINAKEQKAKGKGIRMAAVLGELAALRLNPALMVAVLSSTIDNAIQACEKVQEEHRAIDLKLMIEGDMLVYSVINPVAEPVRILGNRIETAREDTSAMGLGIQKVASALRKLNGEYEMDCDGKRFQFTALIPLGEGN